MEPPVRPRRGDGRFVRSEFSTTIHPRSRTRSPTYTLSPVPSVWTRSARTRGRPPTESSAVLGMVGRVGQIVTVSSEMDHFPLPSLHGPQWSASPPTPPQELIGIIDSYHPPWRGWSAYSLCSTPRPPFATLSPAFLTTHGVTSYLHLSSHGWSDGVPGKVF